MEIIKKISFLLILGVIFSCSKKENEIIFDSSFPGARLDSVINLGEDKYEVFINPAFEPVNKSPWFAFGVSSKPTKSIEITLNYGKYKHRYIPKLSSDKKSWKSLDKKNIYIDSIKGTATIKLNVYPQKTYIAAQEIESSKDTNVWIDSIISENTELKKVVAGKTVLDKNNYCIEFENEVTKNAIVLIARQHPPEVPGGTISFKAFYNELVSETKVANAFREKFNIYAFPLLNPDGADMGNWRHNANGVDLNRDWIDFSQPETKTVKNYIETKVNNGTKIQFAIDFHTSYSGPYLLVLDSINATKSKKIIPNWIQKIETNSSFKVEARRRSQKLPYCYNYFINKFGCEAVTYEEGDEIDRGIIKKRAKRYALSFMEAMLEKYNNNEL